MKEIISILLGCFFIATAFADNSTSPNKLICWQYTDKIVTCGGHNRGWIENKTNESGAGQIIYLTSTTAPDVTPKSVSPGNKVAFFTLIELNNNYEANVDIFYGTDKASVEQGSGCKFNFQIKAQPGVLVADFVITPESYGGAKCTMPSNVLTIEPKE